MRKQTIGQEIRLPESVTHQHLVAVINTLLEEKKDYDSEVSLLDLGCGNGHLIHFMLSALDHLRPEICFTVYGLDVYDAGGQFEENIDYICPYLASRYPGINWEERLTFVSTTEAWPYPDQHFDFIVSNQVMEHVHDHDFVFSEIRRTLKRNGASVHLFPLREVLWEGHLYMPLVHKFQNYDKITSLVFFFAKVGFTKRFEMDKKRYDWRSLREFAEDSSVIILTETNYPSYSQVVKVAKRNRLTVSFRFSKDYFISKILSYVGPRRYIYRSSSKILDLFFFFFCKYISSVTVTLKKAERKGAVGKIKQPLI